MWWLGNETEWLLLCTQNQPQELIARTRQSEILRQKVTDAVKKDIEVGVLYNPIFSQSICHQENKGVTCGITLDFKLMFLPPAPN